MKSIFPEMKKGRLPIVIFHVGQLLVFSIFYATRLNYEFIIYIGVLVFFSALIGATDRRVHYPNYVLWSLVIWGLLHMCGGSLRINDDILYQWIVFPLCETLPIIRYDQIVHFFGFGSATLLFHSILKPLLKPELTKAVSVYIITLAAGLGVGAFNELIEFIVDCTIPNSGVGGYINTSLDLASNFIGAITAVIIIRIVEDK